MPAADTQVEFTIDRERFSLSRAEVHASMRSREPATLVDWYVEIAGKRFGPTQAIRDSVNQKYKRTDVSCGTGAARRTLRKLGINSARI